MNNKESRAFLRGEMDFTPQRMMRYIRSRARLATDEDIEDILQNALVLVTKHFDPAHPEAKLAPYCLGACNKAIAQNLERYHKVSLRKREQVEDEDDSGEAESPGPSRRSAKGQREALVQGAKVEQDGTIMTVKTLAPGKSFDESPSTTSQYRTTSLDSMFDEDDSRSADDIFGFECSVLSSGEGHDPASRALLNDLVERIMAELPSPVHRTCFVLKYVEGYKREDLIDCLKMDAKSIDTIDKRIVRALKAFKDKMDQADSYLKSPGEGNEYP